MQEQGQREGAARLGRRQKLGKWHIDQVFPFFTAVRCLVRIAAQMLSDIWRFGNSVCIWTGGLKISTEENSLESLCLNTSKCILRPHHRSKYLNFRQSPVMFAASLFRLHGTPLCSAGMFWTWNTSGASTYSDVSYNKKQNNFWSVFSVRCGAYFKLSLFVSFFSVHLNLRTDLIRKFGLICFEFEIPVYPCMSSSYNHCDWKCKVNIVFNQYSKVSQNLVI